MADRPLVDGRLDGHAVDQFSANYRRAIGRDLDTILLSQVNGFLLKPFITYIISQCTSKIVKNICIILELCNLSRMLLFPLCGEAFVFPQHTNVTIKLFLCKLVL